MRFCRKLNFCAIKPLISHGPISLCPVKKKIPISFSAGEISKPESQVSIPCLHSTLQHEARLFCVPICSPIACGYGGSMGECKIATRALRAKNQESQESKLRYLRGCVFPTFSQTFSVPAHSGQLFLFLGLTDRHLSCVTLTLLHMHSSSLGWTPFPSGSLGV